MASTAQDPPAIDVAPDSQSEMHQKLKRAKAAGAAVRAGVAQSVSDDRLTGGAPGLVSIGLVPHGVAALREPVESWAFYDHTQHVTARMLCVQTAQLLVNS